MLSEKVLNSLNNQIALEQYSSNLYMSAGSWCSANGYEGSAKFLIGHAKEELTHMGKLFSYVLETGAQAVLDKIDKPKSEWSSLKQVFEETLAHELKITESINKLVSQCFESGDYSSFNTLQWYVAEQHEEEALFRSILDKFKLIGDDPRGLFLLDQEIGKAGGKG